MNLNFVFTFLCGLFIIETISEIAYFFMINKTVPMKILPIHYRSIKLIYMPQETKYFYFNYFF